MKRYLLTMFLPFLFAGCSAETSFKSVGVEEFSAIAEKENTIVVDVRRADEWAEGHLESATYNIDALQEDFTDKANAILPKDKTIAIYCRSGRRSKAAATQLTKQGFEVVELDGGIISWQESGKGVVK